MKRSFLSVEMQTFCICQLLRFRFVKVNWARWLVSWTLELNDAKCRPTGSPPSSSVLSKLANQICNFPSHNPGCKFSQYAFKVLPRPISQVRLDLTFPQTVLLHSESSWPAKAPGGNFLPSIWLTSPNHLRSRLCHFLWSELTGYDSRVPSWLLCKTCTVTDVLHVCRLTLQKTLPLSSTRITELLMAASQACGSYRLSALLGSCLLCWDLLQELTSW